MPNRKRWNAKRSSRLTWTLLVLALTGCARTAKAPAPVSRLWIAGHVEPAFDPDGPPDPLRWALERALSRGLVELDSTGAPQPAAARSYAWSADSLTLTFTLREGLRFTDGTAVSSADFAAALAAGLARTDHASREWLLSAVTGIEKVRAGKPVLVFGDGRLTACKPISDADLGAYLARCVEDPGLHDRILPIGGPGPAITPRDQGEALFKLLGRPARFRQVPLALLDSLVGGLSWAGRVLPSLAAKAELARIGRYYATESMLVWDARAGRYDEDATPSAGNDTLFDHYAQVLAGQTVVERGDHAVF